MKWIFGLVACADAEKADAALFAFFETHLK